MHLRAEVVQTYPEMEKILPTHGGVSRKRGRPRGGIRASLPCCRFSVSPFAFADCEGFTSAWVVRVQSGIRVAVASQERAERSEEEECGAKAY